MSEDDARVISDYADACAALQSDLDRMKIANSYLEGDNERLRARVADLEKPIVFEFKAGGFDFRATVSGPEQIVVVRVGPADR